MKPSWRYTEESEEHLLELGRAGNEDAFFELYRRYESAVFRFALHMSGRREIAEEVVQEVFLALLSRDCAYSADRGTLEAFLIGTARNQVRRHQRDAQRTGSSEVPELFQEPEDYVGRDEELLALRRAVLSLPERYRAVSVLCDLEERSYAEAAAQLGIAVGTVRSRLHRAHAILESKMRGRDRCPA